VSPVLETERLLLREYNEDDAEAFYRLNSDPSVMRFTGDELLTTVDEARAVLRENPMRDYREHGFGRWACLLRDTGAGIGFAGLKYLPETGEVDLGYRLLPPYWGAGLASEAGRAVVRYGFETLGLREITALVQPENIASVRVLENCGLAFAKLVEYRGRNVARYTIGRGGTFLSTNPMTSPAQRKLTTCVNM